MRHEGRHTNDWERVERKLERAEMETEECMVYQEREDISSTNKSYMNNKQLSLKEGMNRKEETIAGEDDMAWEL